MKVPKTKDELEGEKSRLKKGLIDEVEKQFIVEALARSGWNVSKAAREIGISRRQFYRLMNKYKIKRKT